MRSQEDHPLEVDLLVRRVEDEDLVDVLVLVRLRPLGSDHTLAQVLGDFAWAGDVARLG